MLLYNRGSDGRISQRYSGQNITISLLDRPDDDGPSLTVNDIGNFSIWCSQVGVFFSLLEIPDGLEVNPVSTIWLQLYYSYKVLLLCYKYLTIGEVI